MRSNAAAVSIRALVVRFGETTAVRAISHVDPLSYEVDALRGLLLHAPADIATDIAVLVVAAALGTAVASALLPRLAR